MELTERQRALLNKIFRATHDLVCAKCGNSMVMVRGQRYTCTRCSFNVSFGEMQRMEPVVEQWGKEAVEFFELWRTQ